MSTSYADFKEYFTRLLWREGDTQFETDFDMLVNKAEKRIDRDMRHNDLTKTVAFATLDKNELELPADYVEALTVYQDGERFMSPTSAQSMQNARILVQQGGQSSTLDKDVAVFSVHGKTMYFPTNFSVEAPGNITLEYYYKVIPYTVYNPATDGDAYYDTYPDFYEAALKIQCYDYFREFELAGEYKSTYTELLEGMREDQLKREFPSGSIYVPLPGQVA